MKAFLAVLMFAVASLCYATDMRELAMRSHLTQLNAVNARDSEPVIAKALACALPATLPSGPPPGAAYGAFLASWSKDDVFTIKVWREPCAGSPTDTTLYLRVDINHGVPFICGSGFNVLQNGSQYDIKLVRTTNGASFCDDVFANTTFAIDQWSFDPKFIRNDAFTLVYDGVYADYQGLVPAYTRPVSPTAVTVVEYYHAGFDHYFMTASVEEQKLLDAGTAWVRTGSSFKAESLSSTISTVAFVCRFFSTAFDPKSSHFYTADASECNVVKSNPSWLFEGLAFKAYSANTSGCTSGVPVYRLYNSGRGAAPNHRFTTSTSVRATMVSKGWTYEGIGFCAAP